MLRDFPMHLDIEVTSRCNLKCTFCDRQPYMKRGQFGDMDFKLYKRIIDEGRENKLWSIKLSYRGEPLLHDKVIEMISYAKESGILDIYFNTNGMLLTEEMSRRIIDAGLNRISVSVEGTKPEEYEKMRVNAKFETVLKNIDMLMALRRKLNAGHPKVRVQSVNYSGFDLEGYRSFWSGRCDEVAMLDFTDMSRRVQGLDSEWACPQLWQRMTIEWDGLVFCCNNDDLRLLSAGNVGNKTVRECWHDSKAASARELHRAGKSHKVNACDGCPWRTAQIQKLAAK